MMYKTARTGVRMAAALMVLLPGVAMAAPTPPAVPAEVSLIQMDDGHFIFQSDFGRPFYTSDRDGQNKSVCDDKCMETWSPVRAHTGAMPMGDWTLVDRGKNYMQWAYKGMPIYINIPQITNQPDDPSLKDAHWHILKP